MKTMLTLLLFMMGCVVTPEVDSTSQEVRIGNPGDPDGFYWQYRCTQPAGHAWHHRTAGDDGTEYRW